MAERPIWRGSLRLALVSCPIALYSVRQPRESLHFHYINPDTGNRVHMVTQDAGTDDALERRDLKRGFEYERGRYVLLDDEDFERARIDSSSVLTIGKFVPADSIDPVYYDASYYVVPDGSARDRQDDVYAVLRDAILKTKRVALSRLVLSRRERAVALMTMKGGLVLHTLHDMREITDPAHLFGDLAKGPPDHEMVALATQLIERQSAGFQPEDMEDRYEARLRKVIEAKLKGAAPEPEPQAEERGQVIDLMAALRSSLGEDAPAGKHAAAKKAGKTAKSGTRAKASGKKPSPSRSARRSA